MQCLIAEDEEGVSLALALALSRALALARVSSSVNLVQVQVQEDDNDKDKDYELLNADEDDAHLFLARYLFPSRALALARVSFIGRNMCKYKRRITMKITIKIKMGSL